jgi:hypothetical protein
MTPAIKEKNFEVQFFHILLWAYLSALYSCRLNFSLFFIFRGLASWYQHCLIGDVDTGEKFIAVSLTPVNSFSPLTPTINFRLLDITDRYHQHRGKMLLPVLLSQRE